MHILQLEESITLGPADIIAPGEYLIEDVLGAELMAMAGGGRMRQIDDEGAGMAPWERGVSDVTRSRLFLRAGGFGDLTLLTPVLREHKRLYPSCKIGVCCMGHYAVCLHGLPYIDEIVPHPLLLSTAHQWDSWVFFENAIERNPRAHEIHMTELFGEIAGVPMADANCQPDYALTAAEALDASIQFPRTDKRRACIQVRASGLARTYPLQLMGQVAREFIAKGWEVYLLGQRGELPPERKPVAGLVNLTEKDLSFRQSVAVMNGADVLVGPDSALVHVAGALGVPCLALYGPFPWQLRTKYAPTTGEIQGVGECSPCYHHPNMRRRNHFPEKCPTAGLGACGVLASIEPARIVRKAMGLARCLVA